MQCGECGSNGIRPQDVNGEVIEWRDQKIIVTVPLSLLRCDDCGNDIPFAGSDEIIEAAMFRSILKWKSQVIGPDWFWLEFDEKKNLPAGGVTSAWYGRGDKPQEGNWILVRKFNFDESECSHDEG